MNLRLFFRQDPLLLLSGLALIAVGLLMLTSASVVIADRQFGEPFYYLWHQGVFLLVGLGAAMITITLPLSFWQKISGYALLVAIALLVLVCVPGIGKTVNGSRRWISFGIASFQVSEFGKLCFLMYLARYGAKFKKEIQTGLWPMLKPLVILSGISILLLVEPDFGGVVVLWGATLGVLFLMGARLRWFLAIGACVLSLFVALVVISPYRWLRWIAFLHPWQDPFGSGYQLTQALIAFGRGGLWGVGLGNSVQKLFYLPEAHTDFLFAVLGEELGVLGALVVLGLFMLFVWRLLLLGRQAILLNRWFNGLLSWGIGLLIIIQMMVNVGVNLGLLPTKGLTLPFLSYGGSSLLINCIFLAIAWRIAYENGLGGDKMEKL